MSVQYTSKKKLQKRHKEPSPMKRAMVQFVETVVTVSAAVIISDVVQDKLKTAADTKNKELFPEPEKKKGFWKSKK